MIEQIKNDIKTHLLDDKASSELENEFDTLSESLKEDFLFNLKTFFVTLIFFVAAIIYYNYSFNFCPIIIIIFILLGIIGALFNCKASYVNQKLNILTNYICHYFSISFFVPLSDSLASFDLKSLKRLEWFLRFSIKFHLKNNKVSINNFQYQNCPIGTSKSKSITRLDDIIGLDDITRLNDIARLNYCSNDINYFELLPNVYIGYEFLIIYIKCDFRIIRSFMTKEEVGYLFTKISEYLPQLDLSKIVIRQYSSTKQYDFTKEDLDSDIIVRCRENKGRKKSNSAHKSISSYKRTRSKPDLLELKKIQEMRKKTEKIAMQTVFSYEESCNKTVIDVSLENVGYDLLSTDSHGNKKFIEVKGLGSQSDVILTENEITTLLNNQSSYYIYVVDNCLSSDNSRLYILNALDVNDFRKTVAEYSINYNDQEEKADIICLL